MGSRRTVAVWLTSLILITVMADPVGAGVPAPRMAVAYRDAPIAVTGAVVDLVVVQPGNWVVIAKATVIHQSATRGVTCWLEAEGDFDQVFVSNGSDRRQILLTVVHHFATQGQATLRCDAVPGATAQVERIRLFAYRVSRLTNRQLPGGSEWTDGSGSPEAIAGWADGPLALSNGSLGTVGSLALPAGRWWVVAKLYANNESTAATSSVDCQLELGSAGSGYVTARVRDQLRHGASSVLPLEHAGRLSGAGVARVRCHATLPTTGAFLKIVAIRVGRLISGTLGTSGTASGTGTPVVHAGWKAGPVLVPDSATFRTMGKLRLPGGLWFILATATVENGSGPATADLSCRLTSDDYPDRLSGIDVSLGAPHGRTGIDLAAIQIYVGAPTSVRLRCRSSHAPLRVSHIRIVAISVESLTLNLF